MSTLAHGLPQLRACVHLARRAAFKTPADGAGETPANDDGGRLCLAAVPVVRSVSVSACVGAPIYMLEGVQGGMCACVASKRRPGVIAPGCVHLRMTSLRVRRAAAFLPLARPYRPNRVWQHCRTARGHSLPRPLRVGSNSSSKKEELVVTSRYGR